MSDSFGRMAHWLSTFIKSPETRESHALATRILGVEGLQSLRAFLTTEPEEVVIRERVAAIEACIWIAQADREIADQEAAMLEELISQSELPWSEQKKLIGSTRAALSIDEIAERLTQPELRELIFAMAYRLASADGRLHADERTALNALAGALGIDEARERSIERATRADSEES